MRSGIALTCCLAAISVEASCAVPVLEIAGANLMAGLAPIRPAPHRGASPHRQGAHLAVTWLGHASTLIQLDDKLVLADPLLTATAGYFSKRLVEPGLRPRQLPHLDAVLVSHMHFDHLSLDTLFALRQRIGELVLPTDGSAYVPDYGFPRIELQRWQTWEDGGLRITAVPARHVGWRYGIDRLWSPRSFTGFVIEYHGLSIYFAGDTGFEVESFRQIRERFPHLDLALLPIAPLAPRDFMERNHMDADEALRAFSELGARQMIPIHFDTFLNSFDRPGDALAALERARLAQGLSRTQVMPLEIGEQRVLQPAH